MGFQTCNFCGGSGKGSTRMARVGAQDTLVTDPCFACSGAGYTLTADPPSVSASTQKKSRTQNQPSRSRKKSSSHLSPFVRQGKILSYTGDKFLFRPHGQGRARHENGLTYEGGWSFGKWKGKGSLTREGQWRYQGGFRKGTFHKDGTLSYENGMTFSVRFRRGVPKGKGCLNFPGGDYFIGKWQGNGKAKGSYHLDSEKICKARIEGGVLTTNSGLFSTAQIIHRNCP